MVGASKILTVSYGTFSCTLEGFDDPFSTMKAIAEYFRDLAAEDRYFGAEPPSPDPEMLHRIAERAIQRRVEARVHDNAVVLRAAPEAAAPPRPVPAMPAAAPPMPPAAALPGEADAAPSPAPAAPPPAPAAPGVEESVAAKLLRIRAAVARSRAEAAEAPPAAPAPAAPGAPGSEAAPAGPVAAPVAAEPGAAEPPPEAPEAAAHVPEAPAEVLPDEAALAPEPAAAAPADGADEAEARVRAEAEAQAGTEAPDAGRAAAALAETSEQAEALAAAARAEAAEQPEVAGAAPAPMAGPRTTAAPDAEAIAAEVARALAAAEAASAPEAPAAAVAPARAGAGPAPAAEIEDEAPVAGMAAAAAREAAEPAPAAAPAAAEPGTEPAADGTAEDGTAAAAAEMPPAAQEPAAPAPVVEAAEAAAPIPGMAAPAAPAAEPAVPAGAEAPADAAAAAPAARVLVLRGARKAAAEAPADIDAALRAEVARTLGRTSLAPEAEAELVRELAEVAREAGLTPSGRALRRAPSDEAAVARLMSRAEEAAERPEARRRHATLAHLKAAVAATEAERELTGAEPRPAAAPDAEKFREDLARVVRPRRPVPPPAARSERPEERPAPLVLVSEQRIDRPREVAPTEPATIRPRRVTAGNLALSERSEAPAAEAENLFSGGDAFAAFAESLGATEMDEIVEAAAVYTAFVEGAEQFSRPQVMRRAMAFAGSDRFSREEGLIAFGRLLREGVLLRARRGLFEVSPDSRYAAAARSARR